MDAANISEELFQKEKTHVVKDVIVEIKNMWIMSSYLFLRFWYETHSFNMRNCIAVIRYTDLINRGLLSDMDVTALKIKEMTLSDEATYVWKYFFVFPRWPCEVEVKLCWA